MILFGPSLLPLSVFIITSYAFVALKLSPARALLAGLRAYQMPDARTAAAAPAAAPTPAKDAGSKRRGGRGGGGAAAAAAAPVAGGGGGGAELRLTVSTLAEGLLVRLEFFEAAEVLFTGAAVLALTLAITLAVEHLGLSKAPVTRLWLSQLVPALAVHVIASLVHSELTHAAVPRDDRIAVALLSVLGAAVSLVLLGVARPRPIAGADVAATAAELAERWLPALGRFFGVTAGLARAAAAAAAAAAKAPASGGRAIDAPGVAIALAAVAGGIGALLLGPGLRHGRLIAAASSPPRGWDAEHGQPSFTQLALLRLSYVANLLVCALWVVPLAKVFGLSATATAAAAAHYHHVRLAALAAACSLNFAAARALVQAHLRLGFCKWWVVRHAGGVDDAAKARTADQATRIVLVMAAKVALQMLALPALQFCALALLLVHTVPSGMAVAAADAAAAHAAKLAADPAAAAAAAAADGVPSLKDALQRLLPELGGPPAAPDAAAAAAAAAAWAARPSALFGALAGYVLAWWPTLCWCLFSAGSLVLVRAGLVAPF